MDRKGIIAVALALVVLVVWQINYSREMQRFAEEKRAVELVAEQKKQAEAAAIAAATPAPPAADAAAAVPAALAAAPGAPATPAAPVVPEEKRNLSSPAVDYTFSTHGGGIARAVLLRHKTEHSAQVALNEFNGVPIGAITERAGEGVAAPYSLVSAEGGEIVFEREDSRRLKTTKKFTVPMGTSERDEYLALLEVTFTNNSAEPLQVGQYFIHTGSTAPIHRADLPTYTGVSRASGGAHKFKDVNSFSSGGFIGMGTKEEPIHTETPPSGNLDWVAVTNQYFTSIITPQAAKGATIWAHRFSVSEDSWKGAGRSNGGGAAINGVEAALGMPGFTVAPGQSVSAKFEIYTGPREYERLKSLGAGQGEIMDFGMFGIVSRFLLASMNWLNAKLGTYAAAIIVLTIIIKLLLWPLQNKATNSMKKMQALQPKMTELRAKYEDDPQKMNAELMKLYKDYGVNPFGGCFPILIQIPIFFGFYNMLGKAVELRNSSFLWVNDLSLPDTVAHLPGFGIPINILPLVMAGTMFWQMAISPKSGDPIQQRVFMFMPLIFVFFCYNFASALALYWTVQNIFSIVQLYLTRNKETPALQKVAAPVKKGRR